MCRAARRTAAKSPPGGGSRSITIRSGCHGRSARESHTCGVIVFWPTRYTSVSASHAYTCVTVPPDFGTSCLADARWDPAIAEAGVRVLQELGYSGISEIEFVEDAATGRRLLLDVNTRAWKWIGLPVAAGVDLPLLAYRDAIGEACDSGPQRDGVRWTFLRDYVPLVRARAATVPGTDHRGLLVTVVLPGPG